MQTEQKITILEEELLSMDTDRSAAIHTAEILSEDMRERDADVSAVALEYERFFKNKDDAVYFAMLPLTSETRRIVLEKMRNGLSVSVSTKE